MKKHVEGTTLVSVIVSFAILMMIVVMFSRFVTLSLKFSQKADSIIKETTEAVNTYYTGDNMQSEACILNLQEEGSRESPIAVKLSLNYCKKISENTDKVMHYFSVQDGVKGKTDE